MNQQFPSREANRFSDRSGFSLTEVAMAVGLMSFALLTIMGSLPVGMSALKASRERTAAGQIANELAGTVLSTSFSDLNTLAGTNYYSWDGKKVAAGSTDAYFEAVFNQPSDPVYSGQPTDANTALQLVKVQVRPRSNPSGSAKGNVERVVFVTGR